MSKSHLRGAITPERIAAMAAGTASASLLASFLVENEIGSAFLFGIFATTLCGAVLLVSFAVQIRSARSDGLRSARPNSSRLDVNVLASLHGLIGRPGVRVALSRQTASRLAGVATVTNSSRQDCIITAIAIAKPAHARIAVDADPTNDGERAAAVTVRFDGPESALDIPVVAGATARFRFYVLLGNDSMTAKSTTLVLDIRRDDGGAIAAHRAVRAKIPG